MRHLKLYMVTKKMDALRMFRRVAFMSRLGYSYVDSLGSSNGKSLILFEWRG